MIRVGNEFITRLVECPKCGKSKEVEIPIGVFNPKKHLTTINFSAGTVCSHPFQAFFDKDKKVRGYQNPDFDFTTPNLKVYLSNQQLDYLSLTTRKHNLTGLAVSTLNGEEILRKFPSGIDMELFGVPRSEEMTLMASFQEWCVHEKNEIYNVGAVIVQSGSSDLCLHLVVHSSKMPMGLFRGVLFKVAKEFPRK